MSTKHIYTTADLVRFGADLRVDCGSCGATRTMTGIEAAKHCGPRSLSEVQARLRCQRCNQKHATLVVLSPR